MSSAKISSLQAIAPILEQVPSPPTHQPSNRSDENNLSHAKTLKRYPRVKLGPIDRLEETCATVALCHCAAYLLPACLPLPLPPPPASRSLPVLRLASSVAPARMAAVASRAGAGGSR
jgi:hypothetical protein